jgi:hypothetical protein
MNTPYKTLLIAFGAVTMFSAGSAVHAGVRDPGVNKRQHHEHQKIKQGIRSGELTRAEAKDLAQEQKGIREKERAYKADGELTPVERRDLHQDMNQASKHIYQEKHDAQQR